MDVRDVEMPLHDRYALARAQLHAGQPLEAARTLEPVRDELPVSGLLVLARAYADSAQLGRARDVFGQVVELDPTDDWARYALARVEHRRGDRDAAAQHLRVAVALSPQPEYARRLEALLAGAPLLA
jgi:Flp pilus assembly protein TadD